jgi:hypothetical protein
MVTQARIEAAVLAIQKTSCGYSKTVCIEIATAALEAADNHPPYKAALASCLQIVYLHAKQVARGGFVDSKQNAEKIITIIKTLRDET